MEDRWLLLGRRAAQSRKDHRARTDHHERSPETVGQKRRRASATGTGRERTAFAIITWNVDSLRALFVNDDGQSLHNILTSRKPVLLCLLEHKLQDSHHEDSNRVRAQLEALADSHGYDATWTFSPRAGRDGLVTLARRDAAMIVTPPTEPKQLLHDACVAERRLLYVELDQLHVLFAYVPNSGRDGRLEYRLNQWEPSVRAYLNSLDGKKPVLYQGDLNVAHNRALDCWGTTDSQFGGYKASGRTREEMVAMDTLLSECNLVDGFRHFHPNERSGTCWAQKKAGEPEQREHWKRYDYAVVSKPLVEKGKGRVRLVDVRHLHDAFEGGRPDHLPVESCFEF